MQLEASGLRLNRGRFSLCVDNFSVKGGEIVGIGGPNGSGKSTFLRLLCGISAPESGVVRLDGKDMRRFPRIEIARHISLMGQEIPMPFALSVNDILRTSAYSNPQNEDRVDEILDICSISALRYRDYNTLSGGEKRMVLFAASILQDAGILLMDEPGTYLDPDRERIIFSVIEELRDKGKSIVLVLHDISALHRYSDKVCLMREGKTVGFGPKNEIMTEENLKTAFGLPFRTYDSPEGRRFTYTF
ncbi:MAG: ABC transporter ATP-binding protein [Candidatus Thermoplasmatota archaeon]|nr:ABC transporter ATP-binding protein [Candidatus Thermoplasmatota archaeon]